ncbi:hypothetical protein ACOVJL_05775, partial [Scardovia wiggsiae]|uniref:hypothetical protein n=1 Tax=Scardovia wiggsiae TaxID=230143 RepID=UPI003BAD3D76
KNRRPALDPKEAELVVMYQSYYRVICNTQVLVKQLLIVFQIRKISQNKLGQRLTGEAPIT